MFGAINASLILELAKLEGYMEQLPLFETVPEYEIKEEYLTSVHSGYMCKLTEHGRENCGIISSVDHPAFTALREHLDAKGYIKIQRSWCNGDRVKKEFIINGHIFGIGEKYSSAGAMSYTLTKGNNKGILPDKYIPLSEDDLEW